MYEPQVADTYDYPGDAPPDFADSGDVPVYDCSWPANHEPDNNVDFIGTGLQFEQAFQDITAYCADFQQHEQVSAFQPYHRPLPHELYSQDASNEQQGYVDAFDQNLVAQQQQYPQEEVLLQPKPLYKLQSAPERVIRVPAKIVKRRRSLYRERDHQVFDLQSPDDDHQQPVNELSTPLNYLHEAEKSKLASTRKAKASIDRSQLESMGFRMLKKRLPQFRDLRNRAKVLQNASELIDFMADFIVTLINDQEAGDCRMHHNPFDKPIETVHKLFESASQPQPALKRPSSSSETCNTTLNDVQASSEKRRTC